MNEKKSNHGRWKKKPCAAYDKDGMCIAVGESVNDLARILKTDPSGIVKAIKKNDGRYAYIMSDGELEEIEKCDLKK